MSDTVGSKDHGARSSPLAQTAQQPALSAYLRGVADAMLAPDAHMDAVLAAAAASDVERGNTQAYFRPPDPRFSRAIVHVGRPGARGPVPQSVTFYGDTARARVTLAELVAAFGPWVQEPPPTSLVARWPIVFTSPHQRAGSALPGEDAVIVSASLLSDPNQPDARVADIDLQRERVGPN